MHAIHHEAVRLIPQPALRRLARAGALATGPAGLRRYLGHQSIEAFARCYFPEQFALPTPPFHRLAFARLDDIRARAQAGQPGRKVALAWPRGHAKTTIHSFILPLHGFLYGWSPLTVLLANNESAAWRLMRNIKSALEQRDGPIAEDFGDVRGAAWGVSMLEHRNGQRIVAFGRGSGALRGVAAKTRPTLVIADDLDDDQSVRSAIETDAAITWWDRAVLGIGDQVAYRTSYIACGTILSDQSLMQHVLDARDFDREVLAGVTRFATRSDLWAEWEHRILHAPAVPDAEHDEFYQRHMAEMLEGAGVLWDRPHAYRELMLYRLARGEAAFATEIQNVGGATLAGPLGPMPTVARTEAPQGMRIAVLDPTTSGRRTADYPGYIELVYDASQRRVYVDYALAERAAYGATIDAIAARIAALPPLDGLYCESNAAGDIIADLLQAELRRRGRWEQVVKVAHTDAKSARIAAISLYARRGQLVVVDDVDPELKREWQAWPATQHDDLLDALATGLRQLQQLGLLDVPLDLYISQRTYARP